MVLSTVGRADRLEGFVDAVLADPGTGELVVVVDGDDPASVATLGRLAATRPRLTAFAVPHCGQLAALDQGVLRATGEVVVLLDDDVVPAPGTIGGHLAHHRGHRRLVVAGPMPVEVRPGTVASVGTRLYAAEYRSHVAAIEQGHLDVLDALWTGNLSLRRDDCLAVGLRSAAFRAHYHADRDLGLRLAAAGLAGRFDPSLHAAHLHSRSDDAFLRDARRQGAGRAMLHEVHPQLGRFTPRSLVADLPLPLQVACGVAGSTRAARPLASGLMAFGRLARRAGRSRAELAAAKVARRVMQWRGAVAGEGP
ncbi:MAG TPA: glycosyltransferase [Acidimicrobiales bacterium]|nr:glycosyltransferase [Acidimicrobiales bacterium]